LPPEQNRHLECGLERAEGQGRRTPTPPILALLFAALFLCTVLDAQNLLLSPASATPTRTFQDPTYHLSFDFPANWTFARSDGEISTFHLDARSAPRKASLRAVVAMPENPFPASTFAGAYLYFSVTPHSSAASCARQAAPDAARSASTRLAEIPFTHGHAEQKSICTIERDDAYTTAHRGACYRFDLAINNFCGGEVSGVKDITPEELDQVRNRLESILSTIRFDPR
jgi:hypothetical protein